MYKEIYSATSGNKWSGNPNQALVSEVNNHILRGKALDIGAGEGADAVWLSQQGFQVTALEPSSIAVARMSELVAATNAEIEIINTTFEQAKLGQYQLVTAFYTPLLADAESVEKLLTAVAPGGVLLVVHHSNVEPMARRLGKRVADFLLPSVLKEAVATTWAQSFKVVKHGVFDRHVSHGDGVGHNQDELILLQRALKL